MKPWERIEPTKVTKVGWRTIVSKTFLTQAGKKAVFDTKDPEGSHCAAVIALTPDNQVLVAKQFRAGPEKIMWELPGGMVDKAEDPIDAARRELAEETGYVPQTITLLGHSYKDAYSNTTHHYFIARGCHKTGKTTPDEHEIIDTELITVARLFKNARTAQMTDIEAVFLAYEQLKELEG